MAGIGDLIRQAREIVQDLGMEFDYSGDRHSDAKLIRYLNTAMADAFRLRPDLFYPGVHARVIPEFTEQDLTDNTDFPLDPAFYSVFPDYVAGYCALGDDEFSQDGRAVALLNRFSQKLLAKGA